MTWQNLTTQPSKPFKCGYCGQDICSQLGYVDAGRHDASIYLCHLCGCPNVFFEQHQFPGVSYGSKVASLPPDIEKLYTECRACMSVQAHTASVMASRKLLMHIAVEKGAKPNLRLLDYVNYLDENHYTPRDSKDWVDLIREKGNEANHEIKIMTEQDAKDLVNFLEMLLKFIYEYPAKVQSKQSTKK